MSDLSKYYPGVFKVIIVLCLTVFQCDNPFSTRNPELPSGEQTSFIPPVSPETVLANLQSSILERNIENYIKCFGLNEETRSNFVFIPEKSVANNYQGVFFNWTIIEERNYINRMFSVVPPDSISSLILQDVAETQFGDSLQTTKEYDLLVTHTDLSPPNQVVGRMDLSLRKDSNALWYISLWSDFKTEDLPVWSQLKAEF